MIFCKRCVSLKKFLMIVGGIFLFLVILFIILFLIISATSKKLVCKSNEGNITIMYNDKTISGYTANGLSYDLDGQKKYAEEIGIDAYIEEFSTMFSNKTAGSCSKE